QTGRRAGGRPSNTVAEPRSPEKAMNRIVIATMLLAGSAASAEAQRSAHVVTPTTFWFQVGLGAGGQEDKNSVVDSDASAAFTARASLQKGIAMFTVRGATVTELFDNHVSDIGVLAGLATRPTGPFHAGIAAGVGRASGVEISGPLFGSTVT